MLVSPPSIAVYNLGAHAELAFTGKEEFKFRCKVSGDFHALMQRTDIIGIQELNDYHAAWLGDLCKGRRWTFVGGRGIYFVMSSRVTLVDSQHIMLYPDAARHPRRECVEWRRFLLVGSSG
jgi:hypothetical protein